MTFYDGATPLGTGTLVGSTATTATYVYTASAGALPNGSHSITAAYSGNANIAGSSSPTQTQNVHQFSKMTLTASANPTAGAP